MCKVDELRSSGVNILLTNTKQVPANCLKVIVFGEVGMGQGRAGFCWLLVLFDFSKLCTYIIGGGD